MRLDGEFDQFSSYALNLQKATAFVVRLRLFVENLINRTQPLAAPKVNFLFVAPLWRCTHYRL